MEPFVDRGRLPCTGGVNLRVLILSWASSCSRQIRDKDQSYEIKCKQRKCQIEAFTTQIWCVRCRRWAERGWRMLPARCRGGEGSSDTAGSSAGAWSNWTLLLPNPFCYISACVARQPGFMVSAAFSTTKGWGTVNTKQWQNNRARSKRSEEEKSFNFLKLETSGFFHAHPQPSDT